jgi:gliding motility-associated-like protein
VLGGNGPGNALNQLNNPSDTFLGSDGFLYTCDNANWRVLKNIPRPDHLIDTTLALIRPGVYTAVITGQDGCTVNSDPITVIATSIVRVGLTVAPNPVCSADSAVFTGEPQAPGPVFTYQWKINDSLAVDSTSFFVYPKPVNGSTISCRVYASDGCIVGTSDTISLQVQPSPAIADGQVFPLPYGKSVQLDPKINGDVHVYSWTPGFHLSDTTVRAPVADPVTTTVYRLQVTGTDGCTDTAAIEVKVYIPLRLPNAFTPNGDGRNEIFYLLGGPPGLVILEMAVFDRWGQRVFQVRNVRPGDPSAGWTGRFGGTAMPAGTYVYTIRLRMLDGTSQVVKGAVELLR